MEPPQKTVPEPETGSLRTLLNDLRVEVLELMQKEAELARAELREKASALGSHVTRFSLGGAIAYAGLIVLLFGLGDLVAMLLLNAGVDPAMAQWIGRLGVGLLVAIIGWVMFAQAKKAMSSGDLVPEKTLRSLRESKQWMQDKFQHSHESI